MFVCFYLNLLFFIIAFRNLPVAFIFLSFFRSLISIDECEFSVRETIWENTIFKWWSNNEKLFLSFSSRVLIECTSLESTFDFWACARSISFTFSRFPFPEQFQISPEWMFYNRFIRYWFVCLPIYFIRCTLFLLALNVSDDAYIFGIKMTLHISETNKSVSRMQNNLYVIRMHFEAHQSRYQFSRNL